MRLKAWLASLLLLALSFAVMPWFASTEQLVSLPQARQDLMSTAAHVVVTHPAFTGSIGNVARRKVYLQYVRDLAAHLREPLSYSRFFEDEDLVLNYLHDPHTNLEEDFSPLYSPDLLPVGLYWGKGGLVAYRVTGSPAALRTGDRVLAIGGVPEADILRRMQRFFSGNGPWLRTLAGDFLPYGNTLRWMGFVRQARVHLLLERPSGRRYRLAVALVPEDLATDHAYFSGQSSFVDRFVAPPGLAEPQGSSFYAWRLTPDYGVFWLTSCTDTPGYEAAVQAFFRAVEAARVQYVVIDLEQNPGGDWTVGYALLRHMPLRPAYAPALPDDVRAQNPSSIFHGRIYVLVDGSTMSAGVFVAEMLSEMSDAVLMGQPAGMASGAWVGAKSFSTPYGHVAYRVSTVYAWPINGDVTPALIPNVPLPLTVRDIQQGVDPVARWLSHLAPPLAPCT